MLAGSSATLLATPGIASRSLAEDVTDLGSGTKPRFSFFVLGDTHYLADIESPGKIDPASASICAALVDTVNGLAGTSIPENAGGGQVHKPLGVIHTGDIIDTGDKRGGVTVAMQKTEIAKFEEDYGLTGTDGRLKYPVYEVHGNHDSPHGEGIALDRIKHRNQSRPGVNHLSSNGLHYSWDWNSVHFINLGLIVGNDPSISRKRRYAALESFEFLLADLKKSITDPKQPIVITHHIDIARYSLAFDPTDPPNSHEWDPCDVAAYYKAIADYNVVAIFYGHTHARNVYKWNGTSAKAEQGFAVFNSDNGSHFAGDAQAFFYVEYYDDRLVVREYQTTDRWQSGKFTPQVWTTPIATA
jgi:cytolysin (calcineurin-like family phosphatase)